MSLAQSYSAQLIGLQAEIITVEVDLSNGLHTFSVIGLGDRSVEESKDRVSAAIKNSDYISPKQKNQKVVVSLAPADIRKEGPSFDLAIALAYLSATGDITFLPSGKIFLGELSLEGNIHKVSGVLPILCQAKNMGFKEAFVPRDNASEASLAQGITIFAVSSLRETIDHLCNIKLLEPIKPLEQNLPTSRIFMPDMSLIRGNDNAKRGLEIAAAGAHNVLMYGPPGTGKTLLAQSFSSILPPLSYEHSVEVTSIHSAARTLEQGLMIYPPFRSPHHTSSNISVIGGGALPRPGEITLAHRGVLFLDEFTEFDRSVIESLRQPLEERKITISRMRDTVTFPAQTILLASMNPCPCGKKRGKGCTCTQKAIANYWRKLSGPIIDRIDIWLHVDEVDYIKMVERAPLESQSKIMSDRIIRARQKQSERFKRSAFNSEMSVSDIEKMIVIDKDARALLSLNARKLELSGRALHRVMKVSRTIADLDGYEVINKKHILEAISYRRSK